MHGLSPSPQIKFKRAFFIKLGNGGEWEQDSIEKSLVRLGFDNPHHNDCLDRNYESIRYHFSEVKEKTKSVTTSIVNQISTFYEADDSTLWVTFFQRKLWWGFASGPTELLDCGSRVRKINGGWNSKDSNGNDLTIDRLSGRLTKVQMYRGTICTIKESEYLARKINGISLPEVEAAQSAHRALQTAIGPLIKNLSWQDFELLIDLLFSNAGWKRVSVLGKTEKDIDIDLLMPVSGKRAFVQIKSSSNQDELNEYMEKFEANPTYDEMYYITHTNSEKLVAGHSKKSVKLIGVEDLCRLAIEAGMASWLIEKAA